MLVLSDDIYEHLIFDGIEFFTIAQVAPRLRERVLTMNGVSKAYAMTGWRIGFGTGPGWLIEAMQKLQGQQTSGACSISQHAALAALTGPQDFLQQSRVAFQRRRDLVVEQLNQAPGLRCEVPQGAFYVFASSEDLIGKTTRAGTLVHSDEDVVNALLDEPNVATVHGGAVGLGPYIRIAYALDDASLQQACAAITDLQGFPGAEAIREGDFWQLPSDFFVPAALEGQIDPERAQELQTKIVVEGANGPTTPAADDILKERGGLVVPDVLAIAGGVTVSYIEWVQNFSSFSWTEEAINNSLERIMVGAVDSIWKLAEERKVSLRTATFIGACHRVLAAREQRGLYPWAGTSRRTANFQRRHIHEAVARSACGGSGPLDRSYRSHRTMCCRSMTSRASRAIILRAS